MAIFFVWKFSPEKIGTSGEDKIIADSTAAMQAQKRVDDSISAVNAKVNEDAERKADSLQKAEQAVVSTDKPTIDQSPKPVLTPPKPEPKKEEPKQPTPAPPKPTPMPSNGGYTEMVNGVSFVMKAIPGRSFYMGETEVTQALWQVVMGANPSKFQGCSQCPVEMVSWDDVQDFIKKLNQLTGRNYRLPKEAEWEYAAKGGQSDKYAGNANIDEVALYSDNSGNKIHPIKQKKANGYGIYDMSGNVWEWCEDLYSSGGTNRVLRGGSWDNSDYYCSVFYRHNNSPSISYDDMGFRLCR